LKWLTTGNKTVTINYNNSNSCAAPVAVSSTTTAVSPTSVAGTVSGAGAICSGATKALTLSGNTGTVTKWQSSTASDFSTALTDISNTTTSLTTSALSVPTYFRAVVTSGSCSDAISSGVLVTITPDNAATLTSAAGTNSQTVNINSSITTITYTISGATGATFSDLPTGVSGSYLANVATIQGTPSVPGTFNYSVNLTGGCGTISASGTIIIRNVPVLSNFNSQSKYFYDRSFTLVQPTSNSPGTFSYSSSNTSVATISGSTVIFVGPGTTTITATQAPGGGYVSASIDAALTVIGVTVLTKSGRVSTTNLNYISRTGGMSRKKGLTRKGQIVTASTSAEINAPTISNITTVSATATGTIVSDGGFSITARGFCWSTATNPTIENSKSTETGTLGNLSSNLSGLTTGTTYYIRTYITNSSGTTYGNETSFTTSVPSEPTATIGTQIWMTINLDVTTYRDGTVIPQVTDPTAWGNLTTGAWCYYNNDSANGSVYGKIYNWYAVAGIYNAASLTDSSLRKQIAPTGYHVPSYSEYTTFTTFLGSGSGGKMKEAGTSHWASPNTGATNSSGFTALPTGERSYDGSGFYWIGQYGYLWSSSLGTPQGASTAWGCRLDSNSTNPNFGEYYITTGLYVRCIKD
jgi:uncharacterized protein (TIGR02145 family)